MKQSLRKFAFLFAALALVAGLAACGDDDDGEDASASADDAEETASGDEGEDGEADDGEEGEGEGDDGPPDVNPCAEGVDPADAGLPESEEPAEGATAVSVQAAEYSFEGVDALAAQGTYAITLANEGKELHELGLVRLDDSETRPIEEILQSEEEPEMTEVARGFACPGEEMTFNAEISQPGRYVAACFIPVGTTPETDPASAPEGPPHAAQGMIEEIVIE